MTSRQKVLAALAHLDGLDAGADPALAGVLLALEMSKPMLLGMIPEDPAELDELLLTGAAWALGLRSDDAPAWQLTDQQPAQQFSPLPAVDVAS